MVAISVVIPVFNDAEMLRVCLAALAAQTRAADEVIVVDNGSSDSSARVATECGARVVFEPLRGIFPATAAGFDAATGDIVARLDADSRPEPDWLERIESLLSTQNGLTAVTGPGEFYDANAALRWIGRVIYIGGYFWAIGILLGHPPLFGSNFAMPMAMWLRVRGTVNSRMREVHDDLDLSYHLQPDMDVVYDVSLRVKISPRPFDSFATIGRRLAWAYSTLSLDFRQLSPLVRRRRRRDWAEAQLAAKRDGLPA